MAGYRVLAGGAEFTAPMATADRRALELAGGLSAAVRIIPAAAAPDNNHRRAGENGVRWFRQLGARDVALVALTDRASAQAADVVAALAQAQLIYLLGGFPRYLLETLQETAAWYAMQQAYAAGAVLAGSSAGAMVLGSVMLDPARFELLPGLAAVTGCIVPHLTDFGAPWLLRLQRLIPQQPLLGIAAGSALIDDGLGGAWQRYGVGSFVLPGNPD